MMRIVLGLAGVVLLGVVALGLLWLAGQLLVGVGVLAVGTAGVLLRLLWFVVVAGGLGGAVYFVANAWQPGLRPAGAQAKANRSSPRRSAADLANARQADQWTEQARVILGTVDPAAQQPTVQQLAAQQPAAQSTGAQSPVTQFQESPHRQGEQP